MLLAGGQGTRLYALTSQVAKPAVSFGSKYRIIDFTLSNAANSGIDTVGVLTQYQPLVLNEHIGIGEPWDLDRAHGGVHVLAPYHSKEGGAWYKGTANAIYQNLHFLNAYNSDHVLIVSGDHIYKMDYAAMITYHEQKGADCTLAVIDVPHKEASRFGILSHDRLGRITSFEEKPKQPKSNHASMGVYVFKKDALIKALTEDEQNANSNNDFGKNIIPTMLSQNLNMYAYSYTGYWKDVGTITSLWEANMDLLGKESPINLSEQDAKVYSRNQPMPPAFIAKGACVTNSLLTAGCEIYGCIENCIVSEGVIVGEGSSLHHSVIMRGSVIGKGVRMHYAVIDEHVTLGDNVVIGDKKSSKDTLTLVGRNSVIASDECLPSGFMVDNDVQGLDIGGIV